MRCVAKIDSVTDPMIALHSLQRNTKKISFFAKDTLRYAA